MDICEFSVPVSAPSVNLSSPSSTSVDVQWSVLPASESHGVITKYKIFYKEEGKDQHEEEVSANTHHYVITGMCLCWDEPL